MNKTTCEEGCDCAGTVLHLGSISSKVWDDHTQIGVISRLLIHNLLNSWHLLCWRRLHLALWYRSIVTYDHIVTPFLKSERKRSFKNQLILNFISVTELNQIQISDRCKVNLNNHLVRLMHYLTLFKVCREVLIISWLICLEYRIQSSCIIYGVVRV